MSETKENTLGNAATHLLTKEKQSTLGINWLDFGARMYSADLGRWGVIDLNRKNTVVIHHTIMW